jgi:REP element-mobilizing transposase RayT
MHRLIVPDGLYHVTSRGNNKQVIFDDELRRLHIWSLGYVAEDFGWTVLAWAVMSNHYHLILRIGDGGLAEGMQRLNLRLARASNARFGRINHALGAPYWSRHIDSPEYFEASLLYTLWNPARAGRGAHPVDSDWSSYRATMGLDWAPKALAARELLGYFGRTPEDARQAFERFVTGGAEEAIRPWAERRENAQVSVYSGPEPPSGGVRRPPFAVIAPHWTQFDGLSWSSTRPSSPTAPAS